MTENQAIQETVEEVAQNLGVASAVLSKGALLVGGVMFGATAGWILAKRRLESKYAKMAEDEIESVRDLYMSKIRESAAIRTEGMPNPTQELVEELGYAPVPSRSEMRDMHHDHQLDEDLNRAAAEEAAEEPEITTNVFVNDDDVWEWGEEKHLRDSGADPYVLHKDEWFSETGGYVRSSLTYFEGDDVLADEHDTPVDDQEALVGTVNLTKFGHGSGDPNVVYVRNVELQMEIEIVRSEGKFEDQRRGMVEPQSDPSDPRKRRNRGSH